MASSPLCLLAALAAMAAVGATPAQAPIPPWVQQCHEDDPKLIECFINALHHVRPFIAKGIPEIEMPSVEPFRMDELSLSLTTGPSGYRVTLRDLDIYGVSNYSVQRLKLGEEGSFEARIRIPELKINAKYSSSGVLIILPASGNGTFHATLSDITALLRGRAASEEREGRGRFLHVDALSLDLSIKTVRMHVKKVFNNNRILTEATNLFLRENGLEVLKAMMPQLRGKLAGVFKRISNQLLTHVPVHMILLPPASPASASPAPAEPTADA